MFCPKCGQQSSDEVRFCPRCGLSLAGLPAYVAGNDFTVARPAPPSAPEMTAKRLGTRRGAKLMFFSVVLFPIFFGLCFLVDGPVPLFVPLTLFLVGLLMLVYARLFGEELIPVRSPAALPRPRPRPVPAPNAPMWRWVRPTHRTPHWGASNSGASRRCRSPRGSGTSWW